MEGDEALHLEVGRVDDVRRLSEDCRGQVELETPEPPQWAWAIGPTVSSQSVHRHDDQSLAVPGDTQGEPLPAVPELGERNAEPFHPLTQSKLELNGSANQRTVLGRGAVKVLDVSVPEKFVGG